MAYRRLADSSGTCISNRTSVLRVGAQGGDRPADRGLGWFRPLAMAGGSSTLPLSRSQSAFGFEHQLARASTQSVGDLQDHGQGWHVLTTLDFPHMRAFNAGKVGQGFLGDAVRGAQAADGIAKGPRRACFKCGRAGRPTTLYSLLLHVQKRRD
jgi:hypothetical protein